MWPLNKLSRKVTTGTGTGIAFRQRKVEGVAPSGMGGPGDEYLAWWVRQGTPQGRPDSSLSYTAQGWSPGASLGTGSGTPLWHCVPSVPSAVPRRGCGLRVPRCDCGTPGKCPQCLELPTGVSARLSSISHGTNSFTATSDCFPRQTCTTSVNFQNWYTFSFAFILLFSTTNSSSSSSSSRHFSFVCSLSLQCV